MGKEASGSKRAGKHETREELAAELRHLRTLVREIGENFILRQEGEIEAAIGNLAELTPGKLRSLAPALVQEFRKLKVKPAKGRFKDVKELNRLVEEVTNRVITAQGRGKEAGKK